MDVIVPIFVCVVLPVAIVWLVMRARQNETDKKAEIMIKAIEAGVPVDMDQFQAARKTPKTIKQDLLEKLTGGCITSLMGVTFLTLAILRNMGVIKVWMGHYMFLAGGILLAVGLGLFISYFAGKKMLAKEIEAEEKSLEK